MSELHAVSEPTATEWVLLTTPGIEAVVGGRHENEGPGEAPQVFLCRAVRRGTQVNGWVQEVADRRPALTARALRGLLLLAALVVCAWLLGAAFGVADRADAAPPASPGSPACEAPGAPPAPGTSHRAPCPAPLAPALVAHDTPPGAADAADAAQADGSDPVAEPAPGHAPGAGANDAAPGAAMPPKTSPAAGDRPATRPHHPLDAPATQGGPAPVSDVPLLVGTGAASSSVVGGAVTDGSCALNGVAADACTPSPESLPAQSPPVAGVAGAGPSATGVVPPGGPAVVPAAMTPPEEAAGAPVPSPGPAGSPGVPDEHAAGCMQVSAASLLGTRSVDGSRGAGLVPVPSGGLVSPASSRPPPPTGPPWPDGPRPLPLPPAAPAPPPAPNGAASSTGGCSGSQQHDAPALPTAVLVRFDESTVSGTGGRMQDVEGPRGLVGADEPPFSPD